MTDLTDRSVAANENVDMTQVAHNAEEKAKKEKVKKEPKQKQPQAKKKADDSALIGITVKKEDDLADWYQQILMKGDFLEYSDIPGCYIINVRLASATCRRHADNQPAGLVRDMGEDSGFLRCQNQEDGCQELLFPNLHFREGATDGKGAFGGFRSRGGLGYTRVRRLVLHHWVVLTLEQWQGEARRPPRDPSNLRNRHVPLLRQENPQPQRPPATP